MIKPTTPAPGATLGSMIPRILMESQVKPTGDAVEILCPRHVEDVMDRWFGRYLPRSRRFERIPLDPRGSRIWCLIDNRRSIGELVDAYREFYPEDRRQVDERIVRYLRTLEEHGFIEIVRG